jgi:hypothetical protein
MISGMYHRKTHLGFVMVFVCLMPVAISAQGAESDVSRLSNKQKKSKVEGDIK